MRYSHEVPKPLLKISRFFNDWDYALDIKFDDLEYYNFFKESKRLGREVWLDNSLYERRITGIPFDEKKYVQYIEDINPDYYIIPDAYESAQANIDLFKNWIQDYNLRLIAYKRIVVIHGSDYDDYVKCYRYFDSHLRDNDIIAFSGGDKNIDRVKAIKRMYIEGVLNTQRKHHLLGALLPLEITEYSGIKCISSIDTSIPIACSYEGNLLRDSNTKPKAIIHDIFEEDIDINLVYQNIDYFQSLV